MLRLHLSNESVRSLFFFQLVQASFSSPPAAISSHNLQDVSSSRLMKETESHYISPKKFKRTRKVFTNGKKQRSSNKSGDQREGIWSGIYDKHKKRFVASVRTSPIERIQHLEFDFLNLKSNYERQGNMLTLFSRINK